MEKKTKHRILGACVVIGLIVILFPLFQGEKESSSHTTLIKAPPFPDQPVTVSATPEPVQPQQNTQAASAEPTIPIQMPQGDVNQQPDEAITVNANNSPATAPALVPQPTEPKHSHKTSQHEVVSDNMKKITPINSMQADEESVAAIASSAVTPAPIDTGTAMKAPESQPITAVAKQNKLSHLAKQPHVLKLRTAVKGPIDKDGLFKLKNPAWVVQVGTFKNKATALRLVNQLRYSGYRAFIQEIASTFGTNTLVFVGPEYKQTSASTLASELQSDMHIHGIVISYKPLVL